MRHFVKVKSEIKPVGTGKNKKEMNIISPEFTITGKDIMRKGGKFYAVLDSNTGMWSTDQNDLYRIIDDDLYSYVDKHFKQDGFGTYRDNKGYEILIKTVDDSSTRVLIEFNKWFNNLPPNHNYIPLDSSLTFLSDEVTPDMYRSKRLSYDLGDGEIDAYEKIIGTLYSEEERTKIEWSIGSILAGDSKKIEKMVVLYGKKGTGKSTILDLIEKIFDGYWTIFVAEELASKTHQFASAAFKDNPLVAIQDDGSLAKIDSPRINEIVSHKVTQINEKNKEQYSLRPSAMLFLATNELVDIHDTNMGIARRLLDVYPSGNTISPEREFVKLKERMMNFEIAAIAKHCLDIYQELGRYYYSKYEPKKMINKTNYLRNFIFDHEFELQETDPITRDIVYKWYVNYFEESGLGYPPKRIIFGEQLKEYYDSYDDVKWLNGKTHRHVYTGFKGITTDKVEKSIDIHNSSWLKFNCKISLFDEWCKEQGYKAQYANAKGNPKKSWDKVTTTLIDVDTSKLHWVLIPETENYIRIDFDLKDETGKKSLEKNMEAASEFPKTYAEISKSGGGVHLHYFYDGDINELSALYSENIEVKVCKGNSALRRMLTLCNDIPVGTIHKGSLPLKGKKQMTTEKNIKDEKHLRNLIFKALKKEGNISSTVVGCNFIDKILTDAYESGMHYDVSDLYSVIYTFASNSSNHSKECRRLVRKMKLQSEDSEKNAIDIREENVKPIVFYDVEVFPNLFLINWKYEGDEAKVVRMINPTAVDVENLINNSRLIGFNNRRYDNHILRAKCMGYSNEGLFELSQQIISGDKSAFFKEAYNLSYTDVYDFSNKKQSLKKWEIELDIHHQELGLPWDQPVPEDMWGKVAEYCDNDVIATEKVFNHLHEDWTARKILALLSGLSVNDTTNSHTTKIIVGDDKNPQDKFIYTDLSKEFPGYRFDIHGIPEEEYTDSSHIVTGKSIYMGEDPGEGGYVYAEPGIYRWVALLDIASMHPNSARNLKIFGPYQSRYNALIDARLAIKHKEYDKALKHLLFINPNVEEELKLYLSDAGNTKAMAYALKIPINSVYGLTSAKFDNKLKDPRNIDNIVAKRGALFMINLKHEVQRKGFKLIADQNIFSPFTVAHIKTDSIKIPNATPEIIEFVMEYGKKYGYSFEHEATYNRMCLVNDAVYIAQYDDGKWTATGAEFQHPYIFKTLFSKEKLEFKDYCETKSVSKGELYLDMNENLPEDEHNMQFVGRVGSFVPIKPGCGGGILLRVNEGKNYAAAGTKRKDGTPYRWLEAETVKTLHKEKDIDMSYFESLCRDAVDHINEFGDFDRFVNDETYDPAHFNDLSQMPFLNVPEGMDEEVPFDEDKKAV